MLGNIDLSREVSREQYKAVKPELDRKLAALQRDVKAANVPVIVIFEGWSASGKGTLINELILPLDPRGFTVHSIHAPTEEEAFYPFLWRFWRRIPAYGRTAIFDRGWSRRVVADRVEGLVKGKQLRQAYEDIRSFERQLTAEGHLIVKFFLHIDRKEQSRRFKRLRSNKVTAFRVNENDLRQHRQYDEYRAAVEDLLTETDTEYAPWNVVEAHDRRFATLKIFTTVIAALEGRLAGPVLQQKAEAAAQEVAAAPVGAKVEKRKAASPEKAPALAEAVAGGDLPPLPEVLETSTLDSVDLSLTLSRSEYEERLERAQDELRELEHEIYRRRVSVVIAYEGWDAAGKGGNIRRLTQNLDPRGYEVVPVAAPNDTEKAHHYLWRFWDKMPKSGHITVFDRTWYGRVLVERVEGFCTESQWRRAYREINEMEHHLTHFGAVVLKFWLHIDPDEQLRRFQEREQDEYKRWKITAEDWRNREKLPQYRRAIEEMLYRTSTPYAPWTVVESNCKWYARVKVLETVCAAIRARLKRK